MAAMSVILLTRILNWYSSAHTPPEPVIFLVTPIVQHTAGNSMKK